MKPDFKINEQTKLAIGEIIKTNNKLIIPIYSMKILIIKKPAILWVEARPKGIVLAERENSWYLSFDEDRMVISTLSSKIPGLDELLTNSFRY